MNFSSSWIYTTNRICEKQSTFFRKSFTLSEIPPKAEIFISASSRYKLYINGALLCNGPLKGDEYRKYFDRIDVAPHLKTGKNTMAVHVLYFYADPFGAISFETGPTSLVNSSRGGLFVHSVDSVLPVDTDESWQCLSDESYSFMAANKAKYAGDTEHVNAEKYPAHWNSNDFDDSGFSPAVIVCPAQQCIGYGILSEWQLCERNIPFMREEEISPLKIDKSSSSVDFEGLLNGSSVLIPANTEAFVEIDMGKLVTAYVNLEMVSETGKDFVNLLYSECYYAGCDSSGEPFKGVRDDCSNGFLSGECDTYLSAQGTNTYEPFFFRTFRYIRLSFKSTEKPLLINGIKFRLTGYPLAVTGTFNATDSDLNKMWEISKWTLERCMHETYTDCPYYEQMQYIMDTMSQMLFSYALSSDDRLARKAICDFHSTQRPDGMITSQAPSNIRQIIPIFSIYFIDILYNHFLYFADKSLIWDYFPSILKILSYFDKKIDPDTGLVKNIGYWHFIDWVDEWHCNYGSPIADDEDGIVYIDSMIYAYGLSQAAKLMNCIGMQDVSAHLMERHQNIIDAINQYAYDKASKYYATKTNDTRFCQHAQLWAVLSGCIAGNEATFLMERCVSDENLLQCSYSMSFYLFRACELAGVYESTVPLWNTWKQLIDLGVTTWPEDPVTQRSECHGWSALPLYEFPSVVMGIKPLEPGFESILIKPQALTLGDMECRMATCKGDIYCKRSIEPLEMGCNVTLSVKLPSLIPVCIETPDGMRFAFNQKEINFSFAAIEHDNGQHAILALPNLHS